MPSSTVAFVSSSSLTRRMLAPAIWRSSNSLEIELIGTQSSSRYW